MEIVFTEELYKIVIKKTNSNHFLHAAKTKMIDNIQSGRIMDLYLKKVAVTQYLATIQMKIIKVNTAKARKNEF